MAAVTPDTLLSTVFGNYRIHMAIFANTIDTGDTWDSGIDGVAFWLAGQADGNTTQASAGVGATHSSGTFTLVVGEENTAVHLLVVSA